MTKENKIKISDFSDDIRDLINNDRLKEAVQKIGRKCYTNEERDFLYKCLSSDGYCEEKSKENKDLFFSNESDNSEYLKLLNLVMKDAQNVTNKDNF